MKRWKFFTIVIVLAVAGFTYAWKEYHRKNPDTLDLQPAVEMDAIKLLKDFEADENAANKQYNDKVIAVKGKVMKVEKNKEMQNVILGNESSLNGVICEFQNEHKDEVGKIVPGQQVNIKGVCTGMLMDVILVRCVIN